MEQENRLDHLTDKERQVATEFVERVRQRFDGQLLSAVLFGSRARGEAEADSDMDVLVVMSSAGPEIRREIRHLAVEVWLEHDIYLSTRVWSQAHWCRLEELQTLLYRNIHRDGINLLAFSPATADSDEEPTTTTIDGRPPNGCSERPEDPEVPDEPEDI